MDRYINHDTKFGAEIVFTIPEMIAQYRLCSWDEYEDESGVLCTMTDEEIEADILKHDIELILTPASMGRKGGQAKSECKTMAVRENGKKGGRPKLSYTVEVACDTDEGAEFVAWLTDEGHTAKLGTTTGNFIDGAHTSSDERANKIMDRLWTQYCNQ